MHRKSATAPQGQRFHYQSTILPDRLILAENGEFRDTVTNPNDFGHIQHKESETNSRSSIIPLQASARRHRRQFSSCDDYNLNKANNIPVLSAFAPPSPHLKVLDLMPAAIS
jgi:hypothetical protein